MRWVGHVACLQEIRNANISVRKPEEKGLLGGPRHRLEDNIKMDLTEMGYGLDSSFSGQDLVKGYYENGNEPSASIQQEISLVDELKNDSAPWGWLVS
jgi:hypothetical protein